MEEPIPIDKLVAAYRKLRAHIDDAKEAYEAQVQELKEKQALIEAELLAFCNEKGVDSIKTPEGTVTRTVQTRYWTNDWDALYRVVKEHDAPQLLERRISMGNMRQFLEENPTAFPPGLQVDNSYVIRVRKPGRKD